MARIRYLKPEFFTDEDLAELPFEARLLFAGLWCQADRAGRLEDRPKFLKITIFPYDDLDIDALLTLLTRIKPDGIPFINRYQTDGKRFIDIPSWSKHQKPHHTEKTSAIPPYNPLQNVGGIKNKKKRMEKGMGSVHKASARLSNVSLTVKDRLKDENYLQGFDFFWKNYPPRNGKKMEKTETYNRYCRLNETDILLVNKAVVNYANSELVKSNIGIKDPKRFLRDGKDNEYWREWIEPEKAETREGGLKKWIDGNSES